MGSRSPRLPVGLTMGMAYTNVRDMAKECGRSLDRGRMFDACGTYYMSPILCDKPKGHDGLHGCSQFGVWAEDWSEP